MDIFQNPTKLKTIARLSLAFTVTFVLTVMISSVFSFDGEAPKTGQQILQLSTDIDTDWRYTKNGWQHMGGQYRDRFAPLRTFEAVHPFIWAAAVVAAVANTTIWAASEWEIARFSKR